MNANAWQSPFFVCFVFFYIAHLSVEIGLILINRQHLQKQRSVPDFFKPFITNDTFEKSQAYTLAKQNFALWPILFSAAVFWLVIGTGLLSGIDKWLSSLFTLKSLTHAVAFCVLVGALFSASHLPLKIYRIFVLEERFGFNTMTLKLFWRDQLKALILGLVVMVPVLYLLFWCMQIFANSWWLWGFALMMSLQLIITAIYPTFLAPLFNHFTPLPDGELKSKIEQLAHKIQFRMAGIFTIDGSKRSQHANAYFSGIGRFRRIVLFDTIVKQMHTGELIAVLAHEMGHNVKKQIIKGLLLSAIMSIALFYVVGILIQSPDFFGGFALEPSHHAGIVLFSAISGAFLFPLTPLFNMLSRKHEFEADAFAAQVTGSPQDMQSALLKLTRDNLSQLSPHPWYSFFHYSHPTTEERLLALQSHKITPSLFNSSATSYRV